MAMFPVLNPSSRIFTLGEYPNSPFGSWSGGESRVRNSNIMLSSQLRLRFIGITEAQMLSIVAHYQGQDGSFEAFALPSDIWSGTSNPADYGLTGYSWRYLEPPSVDDMPCGGHDVEVALVSAQPANAITASVSFAVNISISAGFATAPAPFSQTVSISLDAGAATGS
jgi:hypothetical protein